MGSSRPLPPNIARLRLPCPYNSVLSANPSGQRPITTGSATSPFLQHDLPQAVRLALQDFLPEETPMGSHRLQQWLPPMQRDDFRNPRENSTPFHHRSSQKPPFQVSRALDSQAHSVDIQSNLDLPVLVQQQALVRFLAQAQRVTNGPTRSPRRWDV